MIVAAMRTNWFFPSAIYLEKPKPKFVQRPSEIWNLSQADRAQNRRHRPYLEESFGLSVLGNTSKLEFVIMPLRSVWFDSIGLVSGLPACAAFNWAVSQGSSGIAWLACIELFGSMAWLDNLLSLMSNMDRRSALTPSLSKDFDDDGTSWDGDHNSQNGFTVVVAGCLVVDGDAVVVVGYVVLSVVVELVVPIVVDRGVVVDVGLVVIETLVGFCAMVGSIRIGSDLFGLALGGRNERN